MSDDTMLFGYIGLSSHCVRPSIPKKFPGFREHDRSDKQTQWLHKVSQLHVYPRYRRNSAVNMAIPH